MEWIWKAFKEIRVIIPPYWFEAFQITWTHKPTTKESVRTILRKRFWDSLEDWTKIDSKKGNRSKKDKLIQLQWQDAKLKETFKDIALEGFSRSFDPVQEYVLISTVLILTLVIISLSNISIILSVIIMMMMMMMVMHTSYLSYFLH